MSRDSVAIRIGGNIRRYRESREMSQAEFALTTKLWQPNVCRLEKGLSLPHLDLVIVLSKLMGVKIDDLVMKNLVFKSENDKA